VLPAPVSGALNVLYRELIYTRTVLSVWRRSPDRALPAAVRRPCRTTLPVVGRRSLTEPFRTAARSSASGSGPDFGTCPNAHSTEICFS